MIKLNLYPRSCQSLEVIFTHIFAFISTLELIMCLKIEPKCFNSILEIENAGVFSNPQQFYIWKQFSVLANIFFQCSIKFTTDMYWTITKVDEYGNFTKSVAVSTPSVYDSEITIQQYQLDEGLYYFNFSLILSAYSGPNNDNITKFYDYIGTYVNINPTIIKVLSLKYGVNQITIGNYQPLLLTPQNYSYLEGTSSLPENLEFKFYCRILNLTENKYDLFYNNQTDLSIFKINSTLPMSEDKSCFTSRGKIVIID